MRIQRNDKRDVFPAERFLMSVSRRLWLAFQKARKSGDLSEQMALEEALQNVWDAKKLVRDEYKEKQAAKTAQLKARLEQIKTVREALREIRPAA